MRLILSIFVIIAVGFVGTAFAEPLDEINASVIEVSDSLAKVEISWNHDSKVSMYNIGCVSCIPNISKSTSEDYVVLENVTALNNGFAILYVIAYDFSDEIIKAKQVILNIN